MRRIPIAIGLTLLLGAGLATPTFAAQPLVREHYSWSDSIDAEICGVMLHGEAHGSGVFMLKSGRAGDPTPYFFDNYRWEIVWTSPDDPTVGFIESGNGMWRDQRITLIEGTVYHFEIHEVGNPYQILTLDGRQVLRDIGRITWEFDVDTHGDEDLSNDEFLWGPDPTSLAGPHPLLTISDEEWCETVLGLLDS